MWLEVVGFPGRWVAIAGAYVAERADNYVAHAVSVVAIGDQGSGHRAVALAKPNVNRRYSGISSPPPVHNPASKREIPVMGWPAL